MKYKIFGSSCKLEPAEEETGESGKTLNARLKTSGMTGAKVEGAFVIKEENL